MSESNQSRYHFHKSVFEGRVVHTTEMPQGQDLFNAVDKGAVHLGRVHHILEVDL